MKKYIAIIFSLFLLYGCGIAKYKSLKLGNIDSSDKSITVPGAGMSLFEIKSALLNDGWKVKVGDASLLETGTNASKINSKTQVTHDTAYRMYMSYSMSTNNNHGITTFNISIVSNKTNEEVLNMVGNREDFVRYKPEELASNLVKNLREIQR
jgi:hypothetical protein